VSDHHTNLQAQGARLRAELAETVSAARVAQVRWSQTPMRHRLAIVRRFRHALAEHPGEFAQTVTHPQRTRFEETLGAEVLPLAQACEFLEKEAATALRPRRLGRHGRPMWVGRTTSRVERRPHGVVLILGPFNYPLMLPGIQAIQALVAGNAVLLKPGREGKEAANAIQQTLVDAGLDPQLLTVLEESVEVGRNAIFASVDKVVLTGSVDAGRSVLHDCADTLTPATMELSGCDAMIVDASADVELAAHSAAFGLTLNSGATCIAPRRLIVDRNLAGNFERRLVRHLGDTKAMPVSAVAARAAHEAIEQAVDAGARIALGGRFDDDESFAPTVLADVTPDMPIARRDLFAPVTSIMTVRDRDEAISVASRCPYALGASVFAEERVGESIAAQLPGGLICINDLIVPSADPRLPFGGHGHSGFGVTRGREGLLEMTRPVAVAAQRGPRRHLTHPADAAMLTDLIQMLHAPRLRQRIRGGVRFFKAALTSKSNGSPSHDS